MPPSEFVPKDNPGPESPYHVRPPSAGLVRTAAFMWAAYLVLAVGLLVYAVTSRGPGFIAAAVLLLLTSIPLRITQLRAARRELRRRRTAEAE
jgi:hypothetical protein